MFIGLPVVVAVERSATHNDFFSFIAALAAGGVVGALIIEYQQKQQEEQDWEKYEEV